jgi:hypothetical protein
VDAAPFFGSCHDRRPVMTTRQRHSFAVQGFCGQAIQGQNPSYLAACFRTEGRSTAGALVDHIGPFGSGFMPLIPTFNARQKGVAMPIGTVFAADSLVLALLVGPARKRSALDPDLVLARA